MHKKGVVICFFIVWLTMYGFAQEIQYLKPCYEGDELAKIRQWEKIWVGKKIDNINIEQVKDFLPESLYNVMKDTKKWGEHWFEIVPYRPYLIPPGRVKYTKEGKSMVGPKEELLNWVAGVPFPEPQSGIEVAWNFDCWSRGDTSYKDMVGNKIDGNMKYDRRTGQHGWNMTFAGRCVVPPTPELDNPKGVLRATYGDIYEPREMKGGLALTLRYKNRAKEYDSWSWVPTIRRISRVSTAEKTDTAGGADVCWDDEYGWDGNINRQTYKLLGRRELLLSRHQDINALKSEAGDCVYNGIRRERINVYVVEAVCHDPGYLYSKSIWYVDPELWHITYSEKYDKDGRFWKIIDHFQDERQGYKGIEDAEFIGAMFIDCQRLHATNILVPELKLGIELPVSMFSQSSLDRVGR